MIRKVFLLFIMYCSFASAQDQMDLSSPAPNSQVGSELTSRQIDLEVRQILTDKKIRELEERLKQVEGKLTEDQNVSNRMVPRHVEILKKDRPPTMDRQSSIPYPVYPVIPLQNTDPNIQQTMPPPRE